MRKSANPTRVLCVEDHSIVLDGLCVIIDLQHDMTVVGAAATGRQGIELFRRCKPDVTLLDLQLPDMSGVAVIEAILNDDPGARIAVLTMYGGDDDIGRALRAGACTYLLKDVHSDQLLEVIRRVHAGESIMPPEISRRLTEASEKPSLTPREIETLQLVAKGMRNKEISTALGITEVTVQVHVKNILAKLGVNDRTAAVNVAVRRGIIRLQ